jgi:uncharacterized protein
MPPRTRSAILGRVALLAAALALALAGFVAVRSARYVERTLAPVPEEVPLPPDWPGLELVGLQTADGLRLAAWYVPPRAGGAVLLVHGLGQTRAALLPEARALLDRGLGVLLLELRAEGDAEGAHVTWGDREQLDVRAALDFLEARPEVRRLGALGFSIGGTAVARAASRDARVRCEVLSGMSVGLQAQTRFELRRTAPVSWWAADLVYRLEGVDTASADPERGLREGLPRAVLLVTGSDDASSPRWMTDEVRVAVKGPSELLVVEGAGHGGYAQAPGGPRYLARVADFFAACLGGDDGGG